MERYRARTVESIRQNQRAPRETRIEKADFQLHTMNSATVQIDLLTG